MPTVCHYGGGIDFLVMTDTPTSTQAMSCFHIVRNSECLLQNETALNLASDHRVLKYLLENTKLDVNEKNLHVVVLFRAFGI